jgi:hypothetical protein
VAGPPSGSTKSASSRQSADAPSPTRSGPGALYSPSRSTCPETTVVKGPRWQNDTWPILETHTTTCPN